MGDTAPRQTTVKANVPAAAAAVDSHLVIAEAPFDGTVAGITITPEASIAGAATDTRTLTVINRGQSGAGNTVVATLALLAGVNATAFDEKAFTLSGTAANLNVAAGDILEYVSTHSGTTGLADPGGLVQVTFAG